MQILVLGMHRSGTSMVTRLINMMGAYFGPEHSVGDITRDNPKGFWERPEVFKLNEAFLESKKCTWYDLQKWSFETAHLASGEIIKHIQRVTLGMDAFRPWVLKDPRMCLVLPAWLPHLEVPIAVIPFRDPLEVALSLHKRDKMPLDYALALWEYYSIGLLNHSRNMPRIYINHAELLEKPFKTAETMFKHLIGHGARRLMMPSMREVRAFIDPNLHRSKAANVPDFTLSPEQLKLCDLLRGAKQEGPVRVSDASRTLILQGSPISLPRITGK